jgi:hypothetical protein
MDTDQVSSLDIETPSAAYPQPRKTGVNCSICGELGHNQRACPQSQIAEQYEQETKRRKYTCKYCGEEGHAANYCPKFFTPVNPSPLESLKRKRGQSISIDEQRMALHVLTAADINELIISMDSDSDSDDEEGTIAASNCSEVTFEDVIEIHDNDEFDGEEE